ncbi:hypothetical protein [Paenibacillus riograndensis]|uniref:hypothetical protein n=1 Tax=Paenibacillus riograndensis TaxID=483937 RepID=UPI0005940FF1|nr:hypothetical protein [Paenibacillus riograndensis]
MLTSILFTAPIYQNYGKMIAEKSSISESKIPQKDVGLLLLAAQRAQVPAPLSSLLLDCWRTETRADPKAAVDVIRTKIFHVTK